LLVDLPPAAGIDSDFWNSIWMLYDVLLVLLCFVHIFSLNLLDIPQNLPGILQLVNALLLKRLERGICGMTTDRVSGTKEYVGQKPPKLL